MTDAEIAADYSTATWLGNSQIIINSNSGWYSAGGSGNTAFHGANLGTFSTETSLTMGGQIQTYGDNDADGHVVLMNYSVYPSGSSASTWHSQELAWYTYNSDSHNNYFGTSDGSSRPATIDISTLPAGDHKLEVYFSQQTGASSWLYETYDVHNYVATFTIAATLTRSVSSLTGFSTESGTASAAQSFTVTATHLNGDLTVTPPTGYEVSKTSGTSGFGSSVTLTRDANNKVTAQTVWVRLKSDAAVGSRTGNVTVSGGGTTQVTVSLTGAVTPKPPTKGTVTYPSNQSEGRVTVPWTKNTAGNNVMVVRVANNGTAPAPANGTAYSTGAGLGGQIVYNGSGTSYTDSGLTAGTDYDYYLFSVSGNYYSTGVKVDATASKAPRFGTSSVSKSTTVGGTASNTQTASGTPSSMTYSVRCTAGGATTGFSVNNSGVFSFSPTAAGTYVFTVSAANGVTAVSASSYTITVTATAAAPTVGSPSRTSTTAVGATLGGTVSSTGGETVTAWGVVYSATSLNTDPTVGGTGCTNVTASGTPGESAFTAAVTGLKANTEYKWKAYAVNSVGTGYTAVQTFTTPCMSAGPVVTPTPGNGTATFTWADVGAVQYLLSLWTGGGGSSTLVSENFQGFSSVTGYSTTESSQTINGKTWAYTSCIISPTAAANGSGTKGQVQMQASNGILVFPPSLNGVKTVKVVARGGNSIKLQQNVNGSWTTLETWSLTSSGAEYTHTFSTAQNGVSLRIRADTSNAKYVHDVTISGESVTYVTGYGAAGAEVTSPVTVSGLTPGTTYNWSMKAVGGGTGCEEDATAADGYNFTVTPTADPEPNVEVSEGGSTIGATVSWGSCDIADGAVTKTFTVRNSGDAALASLGNPSLGTGGQGFTVSSMGAGSLSVNGTTTFTVTFTPAAAMSVGVTKTDTVSFDWDGNTYTFTVTATVPAATLTASKTSIPGFIGTDGYAGTGKSFTLSGLHLTTADVEFTLSDTDTWQVKVGSASYASSGSITPSSGSVPSTTIYVRLKNGATAGNKTGTLTISGGGAASVTVNLSGIVYAMPGAKTGQANHAETVVAPGVQAELDLSVYMKEDANFTYSLTGQPAGFEDYYFDGGTGDMLVETSDAGVYAFVVTVSNPDGKSATFTWTVTVASAPTITKGTETTSGTGATVQAAINAGGAETTVSFVYGTSESYGTSGTVTGGDVSGHADQVSAGQTAQEVSVSLTGLTQGQMYYFKWTAVNAGGTTVETGSFWQPGDGLEFPGSMNGWSLTDAIHDGNFGNGDYYYTPAYQLAENAYPTFKEYKAGAWYTAQSSQRYVNGVECHYTDTDTEGSHGNNTLSSGYAGYYTWRGRDTGSGIEYVIMYTPNAPVEITSASDDHAAKGTAGVTVTATLSGTPSGQEKVYVRYKIGTGSFELHEMAVSGTTATYTIPGQGKGTTVEYYLLTSPHAYVGSDPDLCTLRGKRDTAGNFTYTTTLLPPRNCSVTMGYEKATLAWNLNAAGNAVMIVRYDGLTPSVTAPSDGASYPADTSQLGGFVVYGAYADTGESPSLANVVSQGAPYTYVLYSVEGTGNGSKYSAGVTVSGTTLSLGTPELVDVDGSWLLAGAANGEQYVVVRTASGETSTAAGSAATVPSVGDTWCGGKVVYVGTAETFTDSQAMTGCETYSYRPYLKANGEAIWATGDVSADTVTAEAPGTPAVTGTSRTDNSITVTFTAADRASGYRLSVWTGGDGTTVTDTLNREATGRPNSTSYDSWSGVSDESDAEYAGQSAGDHDSIQLRSSNSNSGIITTASGGKAKKVTVTWDSNTPEERTLDIYGKNTAYTSPTELYNSGTRGTLLGSIVCGTSTELTINGNYEYIGMRSGNNAIYLDEIKIMWASGAGVSYVAGYDENGGSVSPTSAMVGGLLAGTTYNYSLWAIGSSASCKSTPAEGAVTTTGTQAPGQPTLSAEAVDAGTATVTATAGSPAGESLVIYRFATEAAAGTAAASTPAAAGAGWTLVSDSATSGTAVTDGSGLSGCATYWYVAWAVNGSGSGVAYSPASAVASVTMPTPAALTGLGHGTPGAHNASLTWSAAAGATGYAIDLWHYEGGSGGGEYTKLTSAPESWAGTYVVVANGTSTAMNSTCSGATAGYLGTTSMTIEESVIASADASVLWTIAGNDTDGYTIYSESAKKYYNPSTSTGTGGWGDSAVGSWTISMASGGETTISHKGGSNVLMYNSTSPRFACYASSFAQGYKLNLYKQTGASGTKVDDVIGGVVQAGSAVTVTASGATGVNLGGLTDGTTYGWDVKAQGVECTGAASASDTFKTAELLGAPTINTPLTAGVEQLGGTITGAAGATMILKRYESEDAAMAGTADGSLGGVVVPTTAGAAGTWTFADTGLDGCKTYYYRAWQKATVEGEQATSSGSNVASAQTELGTPTVAAVGAGTQMTISWNAVPGAVSYKVMLTDTEGVWTTTGGSGTTKLSMDFAGITSDHDTELKSTNLAANGLTGWSVQKVWTVVEEGEGATTLKYVKLGSSSYGGSLATPQIAAMSSGGIATFDLKDYVGGSTADSSTVAVGIKYTGDADFTTLQTFTPSTDWQNFQVSITGTKAFQLQLSSSAGKNRFYIDNLVVTENGSGGGSSGKVGLKYEATVTSAPFERTVDGLTMGETYWYKVIATGAEGCEKTSAVESGTPANAPLIQVTPMHYNFGTVNKNEGGATATFTVRNTGSIALKFSSVALVQDGDAYSITAPAGSALTADLAAGASRTYTVKFDPQVSGTRTATLRFVNDAYNVTGEVPPASGTPTYGNLDIPLTGTCYDPATADPTVYWLKVEDELGIEDTVTDESMAHEDHEPVLTVLTWHYNRSYRTLTGEKAARWTLYDPSGNVATKANAAALENQPFTAVEDYVYDGKTCAKFSAPIPALGTGKAVRGTYTVKVKVWDSTGTYWTETTHFVPIETGWLFDDFTRADREATGSGALENGWTAMTSGGAVAGEAAIHADALELYGANGECPGVAGRIAVARDMSDVGYATDPHDFVGTGSWGFHFKTGAKTVGFGDGSTAGAFVLGSTASTWLTATPGQVGYAVAMRDDAVQLVKFEGSLLANGTITQLGEAQYSGTQGKLLAVRVDFLPGQDEVDADAADDGVAHAAVPAKYRLYVKEVAATGGSPIAECTAADKVLEWEFPSPEDHDLRYAGMMWNHGVAQVSDKTGAMFDDIYMPHMEGQTEPMMFHVIDEDTEGPEFYGISLRGAVAAPDVAASGLTVTGMVHDASGVVGNVAWAVYNGETLLTSGTATPAAVSGSTTEYTLSCTIPAGTIDGSIRSADCRFVLTASDGDDDRSENGVNIDSSEGTGSFPFTLCASTPAAPGWATAEADGAEMVVLRWARAAAGTQYIVVRSDEEIGDNASPQGRKETMAEGTTVEGWGKVVYNGTGDNHLSGTWTAREFIVKEGSANYFAVYGMTGDDETGFYFSAPTKPNAYKWETTDEGTGEVTVHTATNGSGVPVASSVTEGGWPCTTAKYEPGEGVDAFAYRTSVTEPGDTDPQQWALEFNYETRPETGSGWGGPWTGDVGTWKVHDGSLLSEGTHYPAPTGNKLYWHDTSHEESTSTEVKLTRQLKNPDSGEFYMAALMNYFEPDTSTGAEGKWIQVALVDASGNDIVSFGMPGWDHNVAAIEYNGGQYCGAENIERDGFHLNSGHGNDYVVVGQLSREDHLFRMWVYYGGQYNTGASQVTIPELYSKKDNGVEVPVGTERTALNTVQADFDFGENTTLPAVAGIQLRAGSVSGKELGHVYFDEVRFANTWEELFLFNAPEVYTYDFDKPEDTSGRLDPVNPTDDEGHRQWQISDGALAHGNVGLNAQFGLYHRTGIKEASFTILDKEGNQILKQQQNNAGKTAPETGGTLASVALDGTRGRTYSDWSTPAGGAMGVAVPTNKISLEETYTVEVKLKSAGGKEALATAASETGGAGASDLFFGEYGEGDYWDKYVEIYNGTGHDVDLSQYYLVRLAKDQDYSTTYYGLSLDSTTPYERIFPENSTDPHRWLPHGKTIVLLNDAKIGDSDKPAGHEQYLRYLDRLATMQNVLTLSNCLFHVMNTKVLDAGGDTAYLLITKEAFDNPDSEGNNAGSAYNKAWIDACGLAGESMERTGGKYIMSRRDTAVYLPRSAPDVIDPSEWDYRDWSYGDDDDYPNYENFISTAGWNDRKLGLGGNMEFKVFDDDIEPPTLVRGGVRVRKADGTLEEDYRAVSAGDRTYVVGGWSFTNMPTGVAVADLTLEQYQKIAEMWTGGLTQNGGLSWSSELGGDDLAGWANVIEAGNGKGQSNVEFDGITQRKYGAMIARASTSYAPDDDVWLGFDLDVAQLTDGVLTFGFAGGNAGFKNAYVAWSATGEDGSFTMPNEWNFDPNSGGASTWSEWSRSLDTESTGIPASAGHLWFRVYLSDYDRTDGTFRMDNMRVEGAPSVVRVTDAEINSRGMQFEVHVKDEASGLDAGTTGAQSSDDGKAYFDCGLGAMDEFRRVSLVNGGKDESTISWTAADSSGNELTTGWGPKMAQEWYESTQAGHGKLRLSVPDADDDRSGDQTMLRSDFGMLMVEDDDEAPPVLEMASMKPRQEGTMAEWLLTEKTTLASETMDSLEVGALGLNTTEGTTSRPRYSLRTAADTGLSEPTYAVYQSGWQAGSKYWTVTIRNTSAGAGTITKVSFKGQVGSVLAPTGYTVKYGVVSGGTTGAEAGTTWSGNLLTSGTAWVKEGAADGTTGSPIKTWAPYKTTVSIPLAASGTSGDEVEIRIYGTGTDPKGIGATWYLWDLKFEGTIAVPGEGGEDGYTYVTDASLAQPGGANLPMSGSVYDEGSGLGAAPTYELTRGSKTVSSGSIQFKAARDLSARTSKELGLFEQNIAVSGLGYADLALAEYKGTVHAVDADADRNSAADGSGTNYDSLDMDGQFAFTVVDQDLVGPTAPANVKVNGTAVPNAAPEYGSAAWNEAPWTNKPEFLVSFDVAEDVVPTAADLADATWLSAHGVEASAVKKASIQRVAAGIGEYRVALTTTAAALSNAPAYSVAVAEGAVANYGFERTSEVLQAWRLTDTAGIRAAGERAFPGSTTVAPVPCEGTNSLFVPRGNVGGTDGGGAIGAPQSQVILFENTAHVAPKVGGSFWYYKVKDTSSPRVRISAYPNEDMVAEERIAFRVVNPSTDSTSAGEWHQATFEFEAIGDGNANCILLELYSGTDYSFFDDVRIGVDVGTGNLPTMRYVATGPEAQGLNAKHLFAVDADNNRKQDRMLGETAVFYTPYDCTPPTAVAFIGGANHGAGASTDHVDDPTTQFDLTWTTSGVGPDDTGSDEYAAMPAANKRGVNSLSPWGTFRVYYRTYDPIALEAAATEAKAPSTEEYLYKTLVCGPSDGWNGSGEETAFYHDPSPELGWKHVENGDEIEDVTVPEVDGKRKYSGWNVIGNGAQQTVRLYDLDFDQEYVVVVVGVDKAGNEGPVTSTSWATNNTIKFSVTRGWHMPKEEAKSDFATHVQSQGVDTDIDLEQRLTNAVVSALEWTAAGTSRDPTTGRMVGDSTKDYDLLHWDAHSFRESPDNDWQKIATVRTSWFVDDGGPTNRGSIRFYRASYKDRWMKAVTNTVNGTDVVTAQTPLVSEEVYAQTAVPLRPGQNFVALHGVPYTNTFSAVFGGTENFPGGVSETLEGTSIDFYPAVSNTNGVSLEHYWLRDDGKWFCHGDEDNSISDVLQTNGFFSRAFSINLPDPIPAGYPTFEQEIQHPGGRTETVTYMLWKPILQVPTNGFFGQTVLDTTQTDGAAIPTNGYAQTIMCGTKENPVFNLAAFRLPVAAHPSEMNLVVPKAGTTETEGMTPGHPREADQIYTIDPLTGDPGRACYCRMEDGKPVWRFVAGNGLVPADFFKPNDVLVILSRNGGVGNSWLWTYDPKDVYTLPNRHMKATTE